MLVAQVALCNLFEINEFLLSFEQNHEVHSGQCSVPTVVFFKIMLLRYVQVYVCYVRCFVLW